MKDTSSHVLIVHPEQTVRGPGSNFDYFWKAPTVYSGSVFGGTLNTMMDLVSALECIGQSCCPML